MSGLAGLSRGTRGPICPGAFCVPWDRDQAEVCGTSGTGTNFRGTVPHGCPAEQAGPGQKSRDCPVPSLAVCCESKPWISGQKPNSGITIYAKIVSYKL